MLSLDETKLEKEKHSLFHVLALHVDCDNEASYVAYDNFSSRHQTIVLPAYLKIWLTVQS